MAAWVGLVPALLAALFAGWCGNLLGGVTAAGSTAALAALLLTLAAVAAPWRDPLRLGRTWRLAPLALWAAAAASAWRSPVPRAGLEPVVLLPAFLCLPAAFARCWSGDAARRLGARSMAGVVAGFAAWSLAADRLRGVAAGAAVASASQRPGTPGFGATLAPLGHHPLLAAWLATLLPLALLPLREKSAWRWLGAAAGVLALAAVAAGRAQPIAADVPGRSLAGGAALACEALLAAVWFALLADGRRVRRWLVGGLALAGVALAVFQLQRVLLIVARQDLSALARAVYVQGGLQGWRERPWLGWGPGSVPWTAAWFLKPRPGVNPWGEAVGELHSLPVQLGYELGTLGLLGVLVTAAAFLRRRWEERRAAADPALLAAGCLGLAGAAIASLGTAALAVSALPLALAAAAGAALAGGAGGAGTPPPVPARPRLAACLYGVAVAAALLDPELARWHYDRAVAADQGGRRPAATAELDAALRLDPAFPLYPTRLALLQDGAVAHAAAALALRAARGGQGVGVQWLVAGILGRADGEVWAPAALAQGCSLDPFSPFPPFYLMVVEPEAAPAPRLGARALLAEPRLMAATFWEGREALFRRALEEVRQWPGVDAGWKLALLRAAPIPAARRGAVVRLGLAIDNVSFTQATSLHLFRRRPWPALWPLIALRQPLIAPASVPPATSLRSTEGGPFEERGCVR